MTFCKDTCDSYNVFQETFHNRLNCREGTSFIDLIQNCKDQIVQLVQKVEQTQLSLNLDTSISDNSLGTRMETLRNQFMKTNS